MSPCAILVVSSAAMAVTVVASIIMVRRTIRDGERLGCPFCKKFFGDRK